MSEYFRVLKVTHHYDEALAVGIDHALVIAELETAGQGHESMELLLVSPKSAK